MSDNEFVPSEAAVAAAFDFAELTVPPERLAEHYEIYSSTLALIRRASVAGLGETVPAVGFNAGWQ
ncbi:hypothetical protein [Mycolicibacterium baixiangningiae]|uniref:hypothetical protein n=1 Tax=Mycolicibacterium baixiangningiae TaxID=2761578 RepID=UPI001867D62A|nr:hypothetical protein [Mycolicibacterium baixiangningiae]